MQADLEAASSSLVKYCLISLVSGSHTTFGRFRSPDLKMACFVMAQAGNNRATYSAVPGVSHGEANTIKPNVCGCNIAESEIKNR